MHWRKVRRVRTHGVPCTLTVATRPADQYLFVRITPKPWWKPGGFVGISTVRANELCRDQGWCLHITLCRWWEVTGPLHQSLARIRERWDNRTLTLGIRWIHDTGTAEIKAGDPVACDEDTWALRTAGNHKGGALTISMGW